MFQMTLNREQLNLLLNTTEIMSRIHLIQFDRMADVVQPIDDKDFNKLHQFIKELDNLKKFWGCPPNASYGIFSSQVSDNARTLWDMHQVLRNFISYLDHPEITPENRWKTEGGWTVNFDEVFQTNKKVELMKIKKVD